MTKTTSKVQGFTLVQGDDPAETGTVGRDWDGFALQHFGPVVKVAWKRAAYAMVRADKGNGSVPTGSVITGVGTSWATVCHHGTVRPTTSGNAAERAGKDRTAWCKACASGTAGTIPAVGAAPAPAAPVKGTARRTSKAQPDASAQATQALQEAADRKATRDQARAALLAQTGGSPEA